MVDAGILRVTYVDQGSPPHHNGLAPETFVAHRRRPRRTHPPYPSTWGDRIVLSLLLIGTLVVLLLLLFGVVVAVYAFGALVRMLRGEL